MTASAEGKLISVSDMLACLPMMVTHSFKTIHSNACQGGVTPPASLRSQAVPRGYIAGSLIPDLPLIAMDVTGNGRVGDTMMSVLHKGFRWLVNDSIPKTSCGAKPGQIILVETKEAKLVKVTKQDKDALLSQWQQHFFEGTHVNTEGVDPRLKQVILPYQDRYISVSPLYCAYFSQLYRHALSEAHNAGDRHHMTSLRYGGKNTLNIGSYAQAMATINLVGAPTEQVDLKWAWSLYHKGARIKVSAGFVARWLKARKNNQSQCQPVDRIFAGLLAQEALRQCEAASETLLMAAEHFPESNGWPSDAVRNDRLQIGIFDSTQRDGRWFKEMATHLINTAAQKRIDSSGLQLSLSDDARTRLVRVVIEALRA